MSKPVDIAPVKWFGGKGNFKAKLLPHIPYTQTYVDVFGGGGSVFFARKPSPVEVYNDLFDDLPNLMRVLQNPQTNNRLAEKLAYTLYSRYEFGVALQIRADKSITDPVERAWALFTTQNQGFGGVAASIGRWGRSVTDSKGGKAGTVNKWQTRLKLLPAWMQRLRDAQIDNRCALAVIAGYDSPDTTFYLDPPYIHDTRKSSNDYDVEQPDEFHRQLVQALLEIQGYAVLSGYDHPIYAPLEAHGWQKLGYEVAIYAANGATTQVKPKRTEFIWLNPKTQAYHKSKTLF